MRVAVLLAVLLLGAAPARSQDRTLADIRQELSVLYVEIQRLNRELSTTGSPGMAVGGDVLQRVDLIEQELQRLTALTEELEFRIQSVVQDGTNRIGDLEFRLCELEPDCDIAKLGDTPTLGGVAPPAPPASPPAPAGDGGTQLAVGERADFDAAKTALDAGRYDEAAALFGTFTETYPGGPLSGEAHYYRGAAFDEMGRTADAARAYLESFSGSPDGPRASEALLGLGLALDDLGQRNEACLMLSEVTARYPASEASIEAQAAYANLGCT